MSNSEQCSESRCLLGRSCSSVSTLATTQVWVKTLPTTPQSWVKTAMSTASHQKRRPRRTVSVGFNFSSQAKIQHVLNNTHITGPAQKISIHVINTFWLIWSWSSPSPRVLIADSLIAWYWPNFCFSWGQGTGAGKVLGQARAKQATLPFEGKSPWAKAIKGGICTSSAKKLPISFNQK